jgi:hypothetical protein
MNERIKELAKQARAWAETAFKHQHEKFTSHWDNPVGYTVTQFFEQKFAELIVAECYLWAKENGGLGCEEDFEALKEHFGLDKQTK